MVWFSGYALSRKLLLDACELGRLWTMSDAFNSSAWRTRFVHTSRLPVLIRTWKGEGTGPSVGGGSYWNWEVRSHAHRFSRSSGRKCSTERYCTSRSAWCFVDTGFLAGTSHILERKHHDFFFTVLSWTEHVGERVEYSKRLHSMPEAACTVKKVNSWWWAPWSSKHVEWRTTNPEIKDSP